MQSVSKLAAKFAAVSILISALLVQPVMAASSNPGNGSSWGTFLKRLVTRILDTTDISFPPG
jgi:hypothetical protein